MTRPTLPLATIVAAIASALLLCAAATLTSAQSTRAQNESDPAYKNKFADVGAVRLHYLDFGGNGLPILFIHSASRSASTWKNFAPRFTDQHRVLAITARGHGKSEGKQADVATRVRDILGLLDTLGIERAVFIGNSRPARDMTYLAEHHSSRVAGLVYLANAPAVDGLVEADSTGTFEMSLRAVQGELPPSYRPEYLRSPGTDIDVPALTFVASTGTRGWVNSNYPLEAAKWVSKKGTDWIADPEAKAFLKRLASDEDLQRRVRASWKENVVPALRENERAFKRAFGKDLRVVKLDVPFVSGYQYKNAPASVEPHIRSFLKELTARERAQAPAPTVDHHMHIQSESSASVLERMVKKVEGEEIEQEPIPADSVIQILDASGIENGVLLSAAYFFGSPFIDVTDAYAKVKAENDYVAREASKYPDRLVAFCSFNPLADYAMKEMKRCAENADITGLKLHLANAQFDFRNTEHVRILEEVFQEAARLDLPLVIHLATGPDYGYRDARIFIDEVLASAPDGTVQIAHMAGGGSPLEDSARKSPMQAFVDASAEQPDLMEENVVFDLSGAFRSPAGHEGDTLRTNQAFNERLARHIQDIGVDHVVFGSDWPALPEPGRSAETLRSILDRQTVESLFDNRAPYVR